MAESARRDDQEAAERQDRDVDADAATDEGSASAGDDAAIDAPTEDEPEDDAEAEPEDDAEAEPADDSAEGADDAVEDPNRATDDTDDGDGDEDADEDTDEDEDDGVGQAEQEPRDEPLHADTLIARYRLLGGPTGYMLPWSWSDLPPAETDALVELLDGFVESYNQIWALTDSDTVPPCWHHHPALAQDLAALAWAYFQAYRDPNATPELALRFQAHLPRFRERMAYWLGTDPAACRDGRHNRSWRPRTAPAAPHPRDSAEEHDAVILLGADDLGFPRGHAAPTDE